MHEHLLYRKCRVRGKGDNGEHGFTNYEITNLRLILRLNATRKLRVRSNPKLASMASRSCSSQISALCRRQHHFATPNLVRYMLSDLAFKRANLVSSVYYYNMDTASCEVFLLGDCGTACAPGQCNRFTTLDDCNYYCA